MDARLARWRRDRRAWLVAGVVLAAVVVVASATILLRGESDAYKTGFDVGVALFKSGTPIENCADVRQGAGLPDLETVDEQREFYEGCRAGYEDEAG